MAENAAGPEFFYLMASGMEKTSETTRFHCSLIFEKYHTVSLSWATQDLHPVLFLLESERVIAALFGSDLKINKTSGFGTQKTYQPLLGL